MPIIADRKSLSAMLGNCAAPNARPTPWLPDRVICGWCRFTTYDKKLWWKSQRPLDLWPRSAPELWNLLLHPWPVETSADVVWGPLHVWNRWFCKILELLVTATDDGWPGAPQLQNLVAATIPKWAPNVPLQIKKSKDLMKNDFTIVAAALFVSFDDQIMPDPVGGQPSGISVRKVANDLLATNQFFYDFIHSKIMVDHERFTAQRLRALTALKLLKAVQTPAVHYILNHLIEDQQNFGPLFYLLDEMSEAAHARDRSLRAPCARGAATDDSKRNSWNTLLTQQCAARKI